MKGSWWEHENTTMNVLWNYLSTCVCIFSFDTSVIAIYSNNFISIVDQNLPKLMKKGYLIKASFSVASYFKQYTVYL